MRSRALFGGFLEAHNVTLFAFPIKSEGGVEIVAFSAKLDL